MTQRAKPLPYQKEGVRHLEQHRRVLLADEQGLGKTLQSLWFFRRNPDTWPAVVVCPASLKYMWEREAAIHIGTRAVVCETRTPPRYGFGQPARLYIINYEILRYWLDYFEQHVDPQLVVIDECQRIQNPNTTFAKAVRRLCLAVPSVVGSSGTPLSNRPIELWSVCNIINPKKFKSYVKFGYAFCKPSLNARGQVEFKGAANLDKLHEKLNTDANMIRRLQTDVLSQLPPLTQSVVPLDLHDPRGEYRAAEIDIVGWLRRNGRAVRVGRNARTTAMVRLGYLMQLAARYKLRNAVRWVDETVEDTGRKIVLLGHHIKLMEALERRYHGRCVRVDGTVTGRKRDAAIQRFQHDKRIRYFIGNKAAIEGLTLTAANWLAFLELYWRPGDHNQGKKRIHRIGQDQPCFVNFLVARNTVEEKLCDVIQRKQEVITAIMDGGRVPNDLDILDMLMEELFGGKEKGEAGLNGATAKHDRPRAGRKT